MSKDVATLWGIDGDLAGEEDRLQGRLPLFRVDDRIYAARRADWSLQDDSVDELTAAEAVDRGTAMPFAENLPVASGEFVVVSGPHFNQWCCDVALDIMLPPAVRSEEGFEVRTMTVNDYQLTAELLTSSARKTFDTELRAHRDVTLRAQSALDVLRNTGASDPRSMYIRSIAAARLACDPDAVRRLSKLAQIRLHTDAVGLQADVDDYLSVVLNDPRVTAASR